MSSGLVMLTSEEELVEQVSEKNMLEPSSSLLLKLSSSSGERYCGWGRHAAAAS